MKRSRQVSPGPVGGSPTRQKSGKRTKPSVGAALGLVALGGQQQEQKLLEAIVREAGQAAMKQRWEQKLEQMMQMQTKQQALLESLLAKMGSAEQKQAVSSAAAAAYQMALPRNPLGLNTDMAAEHGPLPPPAPAITPVANVPAARSVIAQSASASTRQSWGSWLIDGTKAALGVPYRYLLGKTKQHWRKIAIGAVYALVWSGTLPTVMTHAIQLVMGVGSAAKVCLSIFGNLTVSVGLAPAVAAPLSVATKTLWCFVGAGTMIIYGRSVLGLVDSMMVPLEQGMMNGAVWGGQGEAQFALHSSINSSVTRYAVRNLWDLKVAVTRYVATHLSAFLVDQLYNYVWNPIVASFQACTWIGGYAASLLGKGALMLGDWLATTLGLRQIYADFEHIKAVCDAIYNAVASGATFMKDIVEAPAATLYKTAKQVEWGLGKFVEGSKYLLSGGAGLLNMGIQWDEYQRQVTQGMLPGVGPSDLDAATLLIQDVV